MNGPDCPIHKTPMDWLATSNQWEFYCKTCDLRYDKDLNPKTLALTFKGIPIPFDSDLKD